MKILHKSQGAAMPGVGASQGVVVPSAGVLQETTMLGAGTSRGMTMLGAGAKTLHQSWGVVALSAGIIAGAVMGMVLRVNYFGAWWWVLLVVISLVVMYIWPRYWTIGLAFIAGMVLAFFRVAAVIDDGIGSAGGGVGDGGVVADGNNDNSLGIIDQEIAVMDDMVASVRDWFAERISDLIPDPEAKLGRAYLLGMKSGLPKDLSEQLKVVGLVHIVVASGAHLSILVEIARRIFGRVSRFTGIYAAGIFIIFFMSMVGWTPSILRAGVMSLLSLVAGFSGRKIAPWRIILMTMAFTLMLDPRFVSSLGWLLSFASFGGIMILGPRLAKFFYGENKPGFIGETVLTTVAATLMTLPITLYYFGQMSLINVLANLLILPTLPYAMGLVFLTGVVAGVPILGEVVAQLATWLLDFHIGVVELLGERREFLVTMDRYNVWVFAIYVLIAILLLCDLFSKKRKGQQKEPKSR